MKKRKLRIDPNSMYREWLYKHAIYEIGRYATKMNAATRLFLDDKRVYRLILIFDGKSIRMD